MWNTRLKFILSTPLGSLRNNTRHNLSIAGEIRVNVIRKPYDKNALLLRKTVTVTGFEGKAGECLIRKSRNDVTPI